MARSRAESEQIREDDGATYTDNGGTDGASVEEQAIALRGEMTEVQTRNEQLMQTFVGWMVERAETTDEDQYAMMASIFADIAGAQNAEEVLRERTALHVRDILQVPLLLHGFEIREGTYEESQTGHYAALTVSRQGSPDTRVVTCGAMKVLMKLYMLDRFGEWPQVIWFTAKTTSKGNTVFDMTTPAV